jgi:hypothetical protein
MRLNELRGLHPRTAELLEKDAAYEGTAYEHLAPWEPFYALIDDCMCYLPQAQRAPSVQVGLVKDKVDSLLQKLAGEDKWATISVVEEAETTSDDARQVDDDSDDALAIATADLLALRPRQATILPLKDLALKGSGIFGFTAEPSGLNPALLYLPTQWCDAVLNSQVDGLKSESYATWLVNHVDGADAFLDVDGEGDNRRAFLKPVEGADPLDLAFLTMQWRRDEEILDGQGHKRTVSTWFRRDYLADVIIDYDSITVEESASTLQVWKAEPLKPHRWGLIPFVWMVPDGTEPGELDGEPMIGRQFMSMAKAADYTASKRDTAYSYNAFPRLGITDGKLEGEFQANPREGTNRDFAAGDPGAFLRIESRRQGTNASVQLLETTGAAIEKGIEHGTQLRKEASQLSGIQEIGRQDGAGAMSGTAVQRLQEPTVAVVKAYRSPIEEGWNLLWRKLSEVTGKHKGTALSWLWPAVLTMTAEDVQLWAQALLVARGGPFITQKTATLMFGTAIGLEDPEAEWAAIEEEGPMMDTSKPPGQKPPPADDPNADDLNDPDPDDEDGDDDGDDGSA